MADQTEVERYDETCEHQREFTSCMGSWCSTCGKVLAGNPHLLGAEYARGYEAGARDMRERAANEIEGQREGGKMTNVVQVFDVLGSAVRSLPLTEEK